MQQSQQHEPASTGRSPHRPWKTFPLPARRKIEDMLTDPTTPTCPMCGEWLAARPRTRVRSLVRAAAGCCDLECPDCRRFHPVLRAEALYLYRVRRLASAVMRA